MSIIQILDSYTANQIAAGEVVERPVSVIKELLENAIDAGATRIKIHIWESGLKRIQVIDNGCGMTSDDLLLAIQRHATSKIKTVQDLETLNTLGFRGEALPSIAAVSKLRISSRIKGSTTGSEIYVMNGTVMSMGEVGCPEGTSITVDDLFFNTPARKKFLKSPSTELGHITDMVGRIALSKPDISFEINHDGKNIMTTPGKNDLIQTVFAIYGGEVARNVKAIDFSQNDKRIWGFLSRPSMTRSSRHYYNFFVNGRYVKSHELAGVLEEAFSTRIPEKKYPIAIVHFQIPQDSFDINVHPAKLEIKFRDFLPIRECFLEAMQSLFHDRKTELIPEYQMVSYPQKQNVAHNSGAEDKVLVKEEPISINYVNNQLINNPMDELTKEPPPVGKEQKSFFTSLRIMGQLEGTYLVAANDKGLYIIDQHAAHERIQYEKIKAAFLSEPAAAMILAVPEVLELTPQQSLWLVDHIMKLTNLGFVLEHFGDNTFLLRGVPKWSRGGNSKELLLDLLEKLGKDGADLLPAEFVQDQLFVLACKSAVKANRFLTDTDIRYLLKQLDEIENPFSCPHGRPVVVKLSREEIRKLFLR